MDARDIQHYKQQSISTMTQGELLLLLYDELVKRLTQAELAIDKQMFEVFEASVQRSAEIVQYLDDVLDRRYPISHDLARMYEYVLYELSRAKIGRNRTVAAHVRELAVEMRDAFRVAQKSGDSDR